MAEISLTAAPVLGTDMTLGANRIVERGDLALVSVATPIGGAEALETAMTRAWGLAAPSPTLTSTGGDKRAIRTAPDQMLVLFAHATPDANAVVHAALAGAGYTTDQTDVWLVLQVSGPQTLAALERLCPLDLHEAAFPVGASARTVMEHMGAILVRTAPDTFLLLSASSSAGSFLHAVETSYHNVI